MKYKQDNEELKAQWDDQIDFISMSAEAFDKGNEKEAKRIAANLRILFHETKISHSLLKQLNLKNNFLLISSGVQYSPSNLLSSWTLLTMKISGEGSKYCPVGLDFDDATQLMKYDDWWNEIIFDDKKYVYTRKDIVLFVANEDGGSHVDPSLSGKHAALAKYNSLGWTDHNGKNPMNNPIYAAIRQIAYEVLASVKINSIQLHNRRKSKQGEYEVMYVDESRLFKWFWPNDVDRNLDFLKRYRKEKRTLYIYHYKNGKGYFVII